MLTIQVQKKDEGLRLDVFLSAHLLTRSEAKKYLKTGLIKNKAGLVIKKPAVKVKAGDVFSCPSPLSPPEPASLKPYNFFVPFVFEDEHILIIDKPAGLVVHPAPGHKADTLVNALAGKTTLYGEDPKRPGLVHRLDRDVSGLMVLAKTKTAYHGLIKQFKQGQVQRLYKALVLAHPPGRLQPPGGSKKEWLTIESFIGRHPKNRKTFYSFKSPRAGAKKAVTLYRIVKSYNKHCVYELACRLLTGRTHQIRVHLSSLHLPLLGDPVYSPPRTARAKQLSNTQLAKEAKQLNRPALYSAQLQIFHPAGGHSLQFRRPWPKDLLPLRKFLSSN